MISDDLHHCKDSITVFIEILQNIVKPHDHNINKLYDQNLLLLDCFGLKAGSIRKYSMEFFATSHGKGPVDAISGTVKWLVNNNIIRRVDDAESFFNSLVTCNTKTKSCYISSNNINSIAEKDLQIISSNVSALNGIFTSH